MIEVSPNASVTLDGSGNGQVSVGPPSGTVWRLRLASVSTTGTVRQPQAFLYRGSTSGPLEQIDSTYLGNSASSGKVAGAPFYSGQVLWAKWTGGDAGAVATLQAYGQQGRREELPFDGGAAVGEGFALSVATVFQAGNAIINGTGLYSYSGAPGAGNLVSSVGVIPGTTLDPTGSNAVFQGDTDYSYNLGHTTVTALQKSGGELSTWTAATQAGPYTLVSQVIFDTGGNVTVGTGNFTVSNVLTATGGTAASPTLITTDTWHAATYANNWATSGADVLKFTLMPDSSAWIIGRINNPANQGSGNRICTLPSGYFNTTRNQFGTCSVANTTTVMPMELDTSGNLTLLSSYTALTNLCVNLRLPLNIT